MLEELTVEFLSWLFVKCASNILYNSMFKRPRGIVALKLTHTERYVYGFNGGINRITLVFQNGYVYDRYYFEDIFSDHNRTFWSWLLPWHNRKAQDLLDFLEELQQLIKGRIVVGHNVWIDLHNFGVHLPYKDTRDTASYMPFMEIVEQNHTDIASEIRNTYRYTSYDPNRMTIKQFDRKVQAERRKVDEIIRETCEEQQVKSLAKIILKRRIQVGKDPVEEARATLDLYLSVAHQWEAKLKDNTIEKRGFFYCRACYPKGLFYDSVYKTNTRPL